MVWIGGLASIEWLDWEAVMHCLFGTWCGLQWDDLGQSLWDLTLEVEAPVSLLGCATLDLGHTAPVCSAPLELYGVGLLGTLGPYVP